MRTPEAPHARPHDALALTRRQLLGRTGVGLGAMALASLLRRDASADDRAASRPGSGPLAVKPPHFAPRARRVIYLHMVGAPSQLDLFEYKPALQRHDGQLVPQELIDGERFAFLKGRPRLLGTRFEFRPQGSSGIELSEVLPHLATVVDKLALVKTMRTKQFNHAPAQLYLQTGFERFGRPSLGAWVTYGLGSPSADLPGFVVLVTGATAGAGNSLWGNGFLPSVYQGVQFRNRGDPVLFLSNPRGIDASDRRRIIDGIRTLNRAQLADVGDPEIATRIAQYELDLHATILHLLGIDHEELTFKFQGRDFRLTDVGGDVAARLLI